MASATASEKVSLFLVIMKSETRNRYFFAFCGKEVEFVARLMASPRSVRPVGPGKNRYEQLLKTYVFHIWLGSENIRLRKSGP